MRVCVIGTGYVGLVSGACLAEIGHDVVCVDQDVQKVAKLNAGSIPIYEPGLQDLVTRNAQRSRLRFSTSLADSIQDVEFIFITVGTPPLPSGDADLTAVEAVARGIGRALSGYAVIVNKSTVPVGCGDWVAMLVREGMRERVRTYATAGDGLGHGGDDSKGVAGDIPFDVVSCPEFLREGSAIHDTMFGDRIVVGSNSARAIERMRELYRPLVEQAFAGGLSERPIPFVVTDLNSAEMIKYAANCFLATKISFINEIANICERVGADVERVADGIGLDHRIGPAFLRAGIGWGGSCFPKDVNALAAIARDYGYEARLLTSVIEVNVAQRQMPLAKLQSHLKSLKGKTIGVLGLAFKPDTDDLRDAPAVALAAQLLKLGARVRGYDPVIVASNALELKGMELFGDPYEMADDCEALVLATEWPEFKDLDLGRLRLAMRPGCYLFVDGRNVFDAKELKAYGFTYVGIGR